MNRFCLHGEGEGSFTQTQNYIRHLLHMALPQSKAYATRSAVCVCLYVFKKVMNPFNSEVTLKGQLLDQGKTQEVHKVVYRSHILSPNCSLAWMGGGQSPRDARGGRNLVQLGRGIMTYYSRND